jgi:tetratricopeptide (TPR) repeat protein
MWKTWLVAGATALTLLCYPRARALAGTQENLAREQVKQATTAYNLGHFDEAAEHYEEAYRLVPDPILLFDIAQSYRLGGKPDKAINAYRAFLRTSGTDDPNRDMAEKHIADLKRRQSEDKGAHPEPASTGTPVASPTSTAVAVPPAAPPPPLAPAANPALQPPLPTDTGLAAQSTPDTTPRETGRPFYKAWWFWTAVGGAVVAGTVTAFLVGRGTKNGCSGEPLTCVGIQ